MRLSRTLPLATAILVLATFASAQAGADTAVAEAGPGGTVECTSPAGATVRLDATASRPATNDTLTGYRWLEGATVLATTAIADVTLPLGAHALTLEVRNATRVVATDTTTITVVDTRAPTLVVTPSVSTLAASGHRMQEVAFAARAWDACDATPSFALVSATSDEAADGLGDGRTSPDVEGADLGTADTTVLLRAERAGGGDGRVYTITYRAVDDAGNAVTASATVGVPHGDGAPVASPVADAPPDPTAHGRADPPRHERARGPKDG